MRILIQFHSTIEETLGFLNSTRSELGLKMAIMTLKPFSLREIDGELSVDDIAIDADNDIRVILSDGGVDSTANSPNQFLDSNPGVVIFDIGRLSDKGLHESALSFGSEVESKVAIAKKISSKLKKVTKVGALAVNPSTGAEAKLRSHRYTYGAKVKHDLGVKILPVAGGSIIKLPS